MPENLTEVETGQKGLTVVEVDGELWAFGLPPADEIEFVDGEDSGDESEDAPDAWRQYADFIDEAQIAWLKEHPEHDHFSDVERWETRRVTVNKPKEKNENERSN